MANKAVDDDREVSQQQWMEAATEMEPKTKIETCWTKTVTETHQSDDDRERPDNG